MDLLSSLEGIQQPRSIVRLHLYARGVRSEQHIKRNRDVEDQIMDTLGLRQLVLTGMSGLAFAPPGTMMTDRDLIGDGRWVSVGQGQHVYVIELILDVVTDGEV